MLRHVYSASREGVVPLRVQHAGQQAVFVGCDMGVGDALGRVRLPPAMSSRFVYLPSSVASAKAHIAL